ncbi:AAA family ATPase [Halomonas denitrificans]|uniref:AAA family ATPase n=1 Tax=Halomonas denitrificans TaxID=370769 RepID=UPI001CD1E3EE|nr:AAA family ATPase [Halomonas denitrificans]MCA0974919.1 AAA family ATPase [Halomonas denitrificans]
MKILALRLAQLASLPGPLELDFSQPPLAEAGLFAITGPTGSGKSTLLDALCLALFGNTPRLRGAPSRDSHLDDQDGSRILTSDPRSLLRRGAASGYAEVDFIGRDGRRYRARWAVRRARDKATGKLQAVEQSLQDLEDERLLTAQKREFAELLPDRLGLNFDQFTRAVLLAQSEFAAFLKADDNARSDLLEKLTDTAEYSLISMAAYQRAKEARDTVARQQALLDEDTPSDSDQRQAMEAELSSAEAALAEQLQALRQLEQEASWLTEDVQYRERHAEARQALDQAEQSWAELDAQRRELEWLERLAPQRSQFQRQHQLARQLPDARHTLEQLEHSLATTLDDQQQHEQQQAAAKSSLSTAERERDAARPRIQQAHQIASELHGHQREHEALEQELRRRRQQHAELRQQREAADSALQQQRQQRDSATETLAHYLGPDQRVADARTEAQQSLEDAGQRLLDLGELRQRWQRAKQLDDQQRQVTAEHEQARRQRDQLLEEGKAARQDLDAATQAHESLSRSIERLRAVRSDRVDALRATLAPDHPCPVCGSLQHPWRNSPPASAEGAQLEATIAEENRQLAASEEQLSDCRQRRDTLLGSYRTLDERVSQLETQLAELAPHGDQASTQLEAHPLFDASLHALQHSAKDVEDWLTQQTQRQQQRHQAAKTRLAAVEQAERTLAPLAETIARTETDLRTVAARMADVAEEIQRLDERRPTLSQAVERHQAELSTLLGDDTSVDAWQQRLEAHVQRSREHYEQARQAVEERQRKVISLNQQLTHQRHTLRQLEDDKAALDQHLASWRSQQPELNDERLAQLLERSDADIEGLRRRIDSARDALQTARTSLEERRRAWRGWRQRHLPDQDPDTLLDTDTEHRLAQRREDLASRQHECQPRVANAQQTRDAALHRLHDDDRRRQRQRDGLEALEAARTELHRWGRISELIGAADGKTFRRIAQAWNLERLIDEANAHLAGLSRRYRLVRGGSPLGLLVIDRDVADERRSVHSLSGGETFLVSLAMALGLASLASGELAIESLFIDEGFGSLDPQSLALAMDALDGLQAQGRRVGVISHVQEMHERIPVQIQVMPGGNGESRVVLTD